MTTTSDALNARMDELGATANELADLLGRRYTPDEIGDWLDPEDDAEPDAEARVLLRPFLADDPTAAAAALNRLRHRFSQSLRGGSGFAVTIQPPYGSNDVGKVDGGRPK